MQNNKVTQLKKHKQLATGLFIIMTTIYFICLWLSINNSHTAIAYIKAFAEAAMIGALADWFAVTALFKYPLGLKIPHTNLIERSKNNIGENLGNFVVSNFLNDKSIRPYIEKLNISKWMISWLSNTQNQALVIKELKTILADALQTVDDKTIAHFLTTKAADWIQNAPLQNYLSKFIHYIIQNRQHDQVITILAEKILILIENNRNAIKEKVSEESYAFIPKFVNHKLANKITDGMLVFFDEIAKNKTHHLRNEIDIFLTELADNIEQQEFIMEAIQNGKTALLKNGHLTTITLQLWLYGKGELSKLLSPAEQTFDRYLHKTIEELINKLYTNQANQDKIDKWLQKTAYRLLLKNKNKVSDVISNTVGKWDGKELSDKLELEVGKDLQYIRINGTLVGGLMGLIIYTISQFILNL
jgi:uncharacterized membrane-anchored protein YjiN (DUF445 family)